MRAPGWWRGVGRKFAVSAALFSVWVLWLWPGVVAAGGNDPGARAEPFVVGAILPLSGSGASLGNYVRNGLELARQNLAPQVRERLRIVYEDDSFDPSKAISAFYRLQSSHRLGAVIVVGSAIGHAIGPLAEGQGLPMLSVGASDETVSRNKKFVFLHWVTPETEALVLVQELIRRKYNRLAFVTAFQPGIVAFRNKLFEEMARQGIKEKVLLDLEFNPAETDFRAALARLRGLAVEAIVVCLFPDSIVALAKQARQSTPGVHLVGLEWFEDINVIRASEGALDGHWYVSADVPSPEFEGQYRAVFGEQPGWGSANAYDALTLVAAAGVEQRLDGLGIARFLSSLRDYHGAAGFYSSDQHGRFSLGAAVKRITKDGFEKVQ